MKKFNKRDYGLLGIIGLIILTYVVILLCKGYIFGSRVDWANQHIVIPEYLRNLFYSSGKIIPSFALNLGMGQNIYYLSYYGLLSPVILLSYLLPFIPMYIYIQLISLAVFAFSGILFYDWIKENYDTKIAFLTTFLFMLNAPFSYHFHRHIMFVMYMPFMVMALKAVDKYLKDKKPILLIIMVLMMILTSYYFSVTGILTIGIYTLFRLLNEEKFETRKLFKIIFYVVIGMLLSGILLAPTVYTLLQGRASTATSSLNILYLLNPLNNYDYTFYNSYYSWGITFVYIIATINAILKKKKSYVFLGVVMGIYVLFPVVSYLYNAFMYVDGKVFLTFLPVALLLVAELFKNIEENKLDFRKIYYILIPIVIYLLFSGLGNLNIPLLIFDLIFSIIGLSLIRKKKNPKLFYGVVLFVSLVSFIISSCSEQYLTQKEMANINSDQYYNITLNNEDNLYRSSVLDNTLINVNKVYTINHLTSSIYSSLSNKLYFNFVRNVFQNEIVNRDNTTITAPTNLLFNIYSATRYLIGEDIDVLGYKQITNNDGVNLYENTSVLPIGYATDKIMSLREFNTLTYPETIDALLHYVIVNDEIENVYEKTYKKYTNGFTLVDSNNVEIEQINDHYIIDAEKNASMKIQLNESVKNKVLVVKFNMNKAKEGFACSSDITINGIKNALSCSDWKYNNNNNTFEYVIASNNTIKYLDIKLTNAEFDISDIEIYTFNYNEIKNIYKSVDQFIIDQDKTNGNKIIGNINVSETSMFKLTVPYESKGYKVLVDGKKVTVKNVDTAFIGFSLTKGEHHIEITYETPYLKLGYILSSIGLLLLIITIFYEKLSKLTKKIFKFVSKYVKKYSKKIIKYSKKLIKNNKGYIFLFISLFILDISLRAFHNGNIHFYYWFYPIPNLFSALWIFTILYIIKMFKPRFGKLIYLLIYLLSIGMFMVHSIYYSFFNLFFDFGVLEVAGEGAAYFDSVLSSIKLWQIITISMSIFLTVFGLKNINHDEKFSYKKFGIIIISFIVIHTILPVFLGSSSKELTWDEWRNARTIYNTFNDNNKSMMVSGMYEYNIRSFYVNYFRPVEGVTEEEKEILETHFKEEKISEENKYTSIFEGKNVIIVQLESIDSFLVTKSIMPTLYNMTKNSINFKNHYSFTSGGGSTFNSEFMVNTGYSTAYNSNKNAYSFSKNNFSNSLANLLKEKGYTSNVFHMNTSEYYSRAVNYKAFGYENYYGLQDIKNYKNKEFWLDTELINNETFNKAIFDNEGLSLSYIITYSAHMPFTSNKGVCSLLTDVKDLTEYQCLKLQAKETDDMLKLIIKNLKERDKLEDTVLVIFSDHYLYTLEDKSLLDKYKDTNTNLINYTPFIIYNNGNVVETVSDVNSQLDILPTLLNMLGVEYNTKNYIGTDIFSKDFDPLVFFSDGSYYNGKTYVANGEYLKGTKMSQSKIEKYNKIVKDKMTLNDAVLKSDYFDGK